MPAELDYAPQRERWRTWRKHTKYAESLTPKIEYYHNNFRECCEVMLRQADDMTQYGDRFHRAVAYNFPRVNRAVHCHHGCEEEHVFPRLAQFYAKTGEIGCAELESQHDELFDREDAVTAVLAATPTTEAEQAAVVRDLRHELTGWIRHFRNHLQEEEQEIIPLFLKMGRGYWVW